MVLRLRAAALSTVLALVALTWLAPLAAHAAGGAPPDPALEKEQKEWREKRRISLQSETGWLSLIALHWLDEGQTPFGSDPANKLVLAATFLPARAGTFVRDGMKVTVVPAPGVPLTVNERPVTVPTVLADDQGGLSDYVKINDTTLMVIRRGDRLAIRARSPRAPARLGFTGVDYFPVRSEYRVEATFIPAKKPVKIDVPTVLGTVEPMDSPGVLEMKLKGKKIRLTPVIEDPRAGKLFIIFRDKTAGKETYPSGRFLYTTKLPEDGKIVIDFNQAYNPPCAFTDFATCPLPPKGNDLKIRIEAGEKYKGDH